MSSRPLNVGSSIRVGRYTYKVKLTKNLLKKTGFVGLCDLEKRTIFVYSKQSPDQLERTLLHEILHAAINNGYNKLADGEKEEKIVLRLESALYPIIQRGLFSQYGERSVKLKRRKAPRSRKSPKRRG